MCLAIPGRVAEVAGRKVVVQYPRERRTVFAGDASVKVGDWVMVQMGVIVKVLKKGEVQKIKQMWK